MCDEWHRAEYGGRLFVAVVVRVAVAGRAVRAVARDFRLEERRYVVLWGLEELGAGADGGLSATETVWVYVARKAMQGCRNFRELSCTVQRLYVSV